jgi:hypothetical protein
MNSATNEVEVSGILVTSKQTDKAVYVAQIYLGDCQGTSGDAQWMPKSAFSSLVLGETFHNHTPSGTEVRREFTARIPSWLARKVIPQKTGPIAYAQRPW